MAVSRALLSFQHNDWVGSRADCQLPRSRNKNDELSQSLCCLDHPCPQQESGTTVASGRADSGDLEHSLLQTQRGSEQERSFLLSPGVSLMAGCHEKLFSNSVIGTQGKQPEVDYLPLPGKKSETILS